MVATSVTVTPTCGGDVSCCNGSSSESWRGSSSRATSGLKGLQERCSAAAAGKIAAVVAKVVEQLEENKSDYASARATWASVEMISRSNSSPQALGPRREPCEMLLLRRVQSFANHQPHATSSTIAAPAIAAPGVWRAAAAASLDTFDDHTVTAEEAGKEVEKKLVDQTAGLPKCGAALHHHPLIAESTPLWCRSNSSSYLQQAIVMGTSCPDFMLFFPRSSPPAEKVTTTKQHSSEKKGFLAVVPASGFDSSTCGSACFSTDDEKGSGSSSRGDRDASVGYSPTPTRTTAIHEAGGACHHTSAGVKGGVAACAAAVPPFSEHPQEGENELSTTQPVLQFAQENNDPGGSNSAHSPVTRVTAPPLSTGDTAVRILHPTPPIECLGHLRREERKGDAEEKQVCPCLFAAPDDSKRESDDVMPNGHADGEAITGGAGRSGPAAVLLEDATTETRAPAGLAAAAKSAATQSGATRAEEKAGEEEAPMVAASAIERCGVVIDMETEVENFGASDAQQAARQIMSEAHGCDDAAPVARIWRKVKAGALFPSPQAPSLQQLLQLPDVFEAAILALRILPERYMQRIEQLDALEALFPGVYVHCSYMARVRQVYVFSRDLILSQREILMQQLLEEKNRRRLRNNKAREQLSQNQRSEEGATAMEEDVFEEVEDEEDCEGGWTADSEQHKVLHAVAGLLMEIKAVQTRVGPTLLAGAAQLADVLHLAHQQEEKDDKERENVNGERHSNSDSTSDGGCVYRSIRVDHDRVNDVVHSSYYLAKPCSNVDSSESKEGSLSSVGSYPLMEKRGSRDRTGCGGSSCEEEPNRGEEMNSVSGRDSNCSSAGTFYIGHCCRGVQMLVDNFLHCFFSCRVASELQREHLLLAVQSGDCGAILSSCVPMEQLIFQAALDVQELALHHLGIAAPVEVWVGEAGQADQQLRAFLLAASIREGPTTVAWSACSSPTTPCRPREGEEEVMSCGANCEVGAATPPPPMMEEEDNDVPTGGHLAASGGCLDMHHEGQKKGQPQRRLIVNCVGNGGDREEGRGSEEGRNVVETAGTDQRRSSSSPCGSCLSSSFAAAVASPRWRARGPGRDSQYNNNAFSRNSSRSRSNSMLPGTVRFPCFAAYAYSGIFELLKNSMRASIEAWRLNRFSRTRGSGGDNCSSDNCTSHGSNTTSSSNLRSNTHTNNDSGSEERQPWRLLTVKRSRKLKKLPGRVRLQCRPSDPADAARFRMTMACSEDVAAAADRERTSRSSDREGTLSFGQNQMPNQGDSSQAKDEDICCEVVQLEEGVLPPIKVVLLFVDDSLIIRIEDQGEGLRRNELQNVWSFAYTTASGKGLLQRLAAAGKQHVRGK